MGQKQSKKVEVVVGNTDTMEIWEEDVREFEARARVKKEKEKKVEWRTEGDELRMKLKRFVVRQCVYLGPGDPEKFSFEDSKLKIDENNETEMENRKKVNWIIVVKYILVEFLPLKDAFALQMVCKDVFNEFDTSEVWGYRFSLRKGFQTITSKNDDTNETVSKNWKKLYYLQITPLQSFVWQDDINMISQVGSGSSRYTVSYTGEFLPKYEKLFGIKEVVVTMHRLRILSGWFRSASGKEDHLNVFEFCNQVKYLCDFAPHPNILRIFGLVVYHGIVGICTEYCHNEDLDTYLSRVKKKNKVMDCSTKDRLLEEIARVILHVHERKFVLQCLGCYSFFLDKNLTIKLSGLRSVLKIGGKFQWRFFPNNQRNNKYLPPEQLQGKGFNDTGSDVFQFGIVCWEIIHTCQYPYGKNNRNAHFKVAKNANYRPTLNKTLPALKGKRIGYCKIIESCLKPLVSQRPSMKTVLQQVVQIRKEINDEK